MKRTRASIAAVSLALVAILLPLSSAHADDVVPSNPPVAPSDPPAPPSADPTPVTTPTPRTAAPPVYSPPLVYPVPDPPPPETAITDWPTPTQAPPTGDIPRAAVRPPNGIVYAPDGSAYYQAPCYSDQHCPQPIKLPVFVKYIDSTGKVAHTYVEGTTAAAQHAWSVAHGIPDGSTSTPVSTTVTGPSTSAMPTRAASSPALVVPESIAWATGNTSLQPSQPSPRASSW